MNLRQMGGWGQSGSSEAKNAEQPSTVRTLTLLAEGTALNVPEIDGASYKEFRERVSRMALQVPDRLSEEEKLAAIREIVQEFESYRKNAEAALRERQLGWRAVVTELLEEVLRRLGIAPTTAGAAPLHSGIGALATGADLLAYREQLNAFLHPVDARGVAMDIASPLKTADRTTANLNAAGLRGGGSAVTHLQSIMDRSGSGYVVFFRLSCLEMISERFGPEAVEDCLMAVSAFLTASLHADDAIYHWSDSSLLAIVQGRANEQILSAELNRIAAHNRDITIQVNGRSIMLRVPLDFNITSISRLRSADELLRLAPDSTTR